MTIPPHLKEHYPFCSNYFLPLDGPHKMHFVDHHKTRCNDKNLVMLHGNPTWSFFYRNLIKDLSEHFRVIAPDHMGCGLSDKPQNYNYTLKQHIDNLEDLIDNKLKLKSVSLIVHDWGGAIGFGYAVRHPEKIEKITILNTAAFTDTKIPKRINICKTPVIGEWFIRIFNGFAYPATFMTTTKGLSSIIKEGFLLPYNNYKNRIATAKFVTDIPLSSTHPSFKTLLDIENKLQTLTCPKFLLWGARDFCFDLHYFKKWQQIYPDAAFKLLENAGHYLLEDELEEALSAVRPFLLGAEGES